jgi:hypothetical protein
MAEKIERLEKRLAAVEAKQSDEAEMDRDKAPTPVASVAQTSAATGRTP